MNLQHLKRSAALVLGTGLLAGLAYGTHAWGTYHWPRPTSAQVQVKLGDNVTSAWDSHLIVASNDWTGSSVLEDRKSTRLNSSHT